MSNNETISESSAVINAPIENVDIADWLFNLPDSDTVSLLASPHRGGSSGLYGKISPRDSTTLTSFAAK